MRGGRRALRCFRMSGFGGITHLAQPDARSRFRRPPPVSVAVTTGGRRGCARVLFADPSGSGAVVLHSILSFGSPGAKHNQYGNPLFSFLFRGQRALKPPDPPPNP